MRSKLLALNFFSILLLGASSAHADDLSAIRAAASNGDCYVTHEGRREPTIALTASAYDLPDSDKQEVQALISAFVEHGCSVDQPDSAGMSPINVSVLTAEPELLRFLLKVGANPSKRISGSRPWANGKNSVEFAQALNKIKPSAQRAEVLEILHSK